MAWTSKQKQLAVRACKAAGISEDQRVDLILRNFPHAHHGGDITSTSPQLTNQDFAAFMAIVENFAGGKVLHFTAGYWKKASGDELQRMRFRVSRIAAALEAAGKLAPCGAGLAGWIARRISNGATDRVDQLDFPALQALIIQLESYARQNAVAWNHDLSISGPSCLSDGAGPFEPPPLIEQTAAAVFSPTREHCNENEENVEAGIAPAAAAT